MTDEPRPDAPPPEDASSTATETIVADTTDAGVDVPPADRLLQTVEMRDVGPCKKHIQVTVDRAAIDARLDEKYRDLVHDSYVSGFRPGKAPREIVRRRFKKQVEDEVKAEVLMASLQQLGEEQKLAPLSSPNLDPAKIVFPEEGPLVYEFEVEVRPEFDLPNYKGLKLRRPVKTFTEAEITEELQRLLRPESQIIPKPGGNNAQLGDVLVAEASFWFNDQEISNIGEIVIDVERTLAIKDGVGEKFGEQVVGANPGDQRVVDIKLSSQTANPDLRGQTIQMRLNVKEVKTRRMPDLTEEYLDTTFGVRTEAALRELVGVLLQRRLEYAQRESARYQVMQYIVSNANLDLPEEMLLRHARKALIRRSMEMQAEGIPDDEIEMRLRMMQQDIVTSTAIALKEHFVLQRIAEEEKIDVSEADIDAEIERIAERADESPRRIRARLEREDALDALAAEMIERKTLDLILDSAQYEEVPLEEPAPTAVATVEEQAVPGEMVDRAAEAEAAAAAQEQQPEAASSETPPTT
jgi:trigger factor